MTKLRKKEKINREKIRKRAKKKWIEKKKKKRVGGASPHMNKEAP
jgi:hypothetical protein